MLYARLPNFGVKTMATKRKTAAEQLRGVSISAVAKVCSSFQSNAEPKSHSYSSLRKHESATHRELWKEWDVQVVQLELANGGTLDWPLPNLSKLVKWHYENNTMFRDALTAVVKSNPNRPIDLIPYSDEYVPGNVLHPEQRKKTCAWYFSVMQFGQALSSCSLWIPAAAILSSKIKGLKGQYSYVHRVVVEAALSDPLGICNCGIVLKIDGVDTLVAVVLQDQIGDELDLKSSFDVKGSGGVKPCFKCTNVFKRDHVGSSLPGHVDITCSDKRKFSAMMDAELYEAVDTVHAAEPRKRKKLATDWGVNYNPNGFLRSALVRSRMRPTRSRLDRLHVFESQGISKWEIDHLIESLADDNKFSNEEVALFCNVGWRSPSGGKKGERTKVTIKDNALKGMASDVLTALPILYNFVCTFLQDWDNDKVESFKALYAVVAQLQKIKFSGDCSEAATGKLADLLAKHSELFKKAYGSQAVKPKHHYALHLPEQYFIDGVYVDCFAMERMHQLMKAESELLDDTSATNHVFWLLSKANRILSDEANRLNQQATGKSVVVNGEHAESVHQCATWRGRYKEGNIILIDDTPHIVTECLKFKDSWGLALERLQKLKDIHACVSEWKLRSGERRLHVLKEPWALRLSLCFLQWHLSYKAFQWPFYAFVAMQARTLCSHLQRGTW